MMNFVVQIVLISCMAAVAIVFLTTKAQKGKPSDELLQRLDNLENTLTSMEKRLKNVETITTSKSYNLEQEFENLKS